ncbi:MAG: hypothetical protein R3251_02710 [Candidatus Spechtbacterales bacterium]|nr:hypothetical protein [Candidatus Spechtbacterales bacterium]
MENRWLSAEPGRSQREDMQEIERLRSLVKQSDYLRELSIKVSHMPDKRIEAAEQYIEENALWLTPYRFASLLESGGEYKVLEIEKAEDDKGTSYDRVKVVKIDNSAVFREILQS